MGSSACSSGCLPYAILDVIWTLARTIFVNERLHYLPGVVKLFQAVLKNGGLPATSHKITKERVCECVEKLSTRGGHL
jgi:hypothetical protein